MAMTVRDLSRPQEGVADREDATPRPRRWTIEEYYRMAEAGILGPEERTELIDGEILVMSPQHAPHATAVGLADDLVRDIFRDGYVVRVQFPIDVPEVSNPEPDIAVVPGSRRDFGAGHPRYAVLIVEVSETTLQHDRRKAELYARIQVPDYWIVDLNRQQVEVRRDPVEDPTAPGSYVYRTVAIYRRGQTITPLAAPGREVLVDDLLPDPA
jgi:Uma2 family endonuclease